MSHDHEHDLTHLHDRDFWEERYAGDDRVWSGRANGTVVSEVAGLVPGTALDVAAGEGGDAIWLAQHGWTVTALDVAENALARGRAAAQSVGVADRVTWVRADARTWSTDERFDLVTSAYLHLPLGIRERWLVAVAALVAPGGSLVVVGHHGSDTEVVDRPHPKEMFADAADLAAVLGDDEWETVTAAKVPRPATVDGEEITLHDAVLHLRRR
ncbi:cyclopropane-fatty-acyl-phospholipid synthase family protein [Cellulomonas sp. HZM]|uniref:SAM-dependent methyltransferase n=1 Tax=Cellulomonas sp. HZM TaxID=1454010 RepID=UPI000493706F|nr:class I SAM-dependent methyltransferase [Cellulomonas sp. HZM]